MATQVQWRGGSTAEHATFTGAAREVTVDTQKQTLVVHDGSTVGGEALLREDQANLPGSVTNGIYTPGTNQVAVATNGTGRLFVDASGNVKITSSQYQAIAHKNISASATYGAVVIGSGSGLQGNISLGFDVSTTTGLNFNGTAQTYFHPNGALIPNNAGTNYIGLFSRDSSDSILLGPATSSGRASGPLTLTSTSVGIGTSAPASTLHVAGTFRNTGQTYLGIGEATTLAYIGDPFTTNTRSILFNRASGVTDIVNIQGINVGVALTDIALQAGGGNVGIGTASPSDTSGFGGTLDINGTTGAACYVRTNGSATDYGLIGHYGADFYVNNNSNGPTRFFTNGSERLRIDSSGRLLVGTSTYRTVGTYGYEAKTQIEGTSSVVAGLTLTGNRNDGLGPYFVLGRSRGTTAGSSTAVQNGDELGTIQFCGADGTDLETAGALIRAEVDGTPGANDMPGRLVFSTTADGASSPTERMRIDSAGRAGFTCVKDDNAAVYILHNGTNGTQYGIAVNTANDQNDSTRYFLNCTGASTVRAVIRADGGLANYSANNANLSDINSKKDISPAADTWNCLKEWEIVNYRYKDQSADADLNLGVIAQQVAESCPEVITVFEEAKDDQPEKLGVKEQQMYWMAIKALQEAQVRIEQLESKVAALESA